MSTHVKVLKVDIFKKDSPRGIDGVIDYFGTAPRGRLISFARARRGKGSRLRLVPFSR
jgi:hypothetical protein